MKKLSYLIVLIVILGLVLTGCLLSNVGQVPPSEQSVPNIITKNAQPIEVCLDFSEFSLGYTVEGMNTVYNGLNIYTELIATVTGDGTKEAVVIVEGVNPRAYGSHPSGGSSIKNGCLGDGKGIAIQRDSYPENDLYNFVFQFSEDMTVSSFSLNILDFGDYNPFFAISHSIALVAYSANGTELIRDKLLYDSDSGINPITSSKFVNLQNSGDACRAIGLGDNLPGNYVFNVNHYGINKVVLELGEGHDPYFGIRNICFSTPELEVPIDIKPQSCPNPLNVKNQGVLPVAILGTAAFDVTQVNPASIKLEGEVVPLRWAFEDAATPFEPFIDESCSGCTTQGPDGYIDLTLKFDAQMILVQLGLVEQELFDLSEGDIPSDGDCIMLKLTGNLFNGAPIWGEDTMLIIRKGKF